MPRKVRKIRRKPGQKRNMYFTADTQAAIVKYQNAETDEEKHRYVPAPKHATVSYTHLTLPTKA